MVYVGPRVEIARMQLPQTILVTIWASPSEGWAGEVDATTGHASAAFIGFACTPGRNDFDEGSQGQFHATSPSVHLARAPGVAHEVERVPRLDLHAAALTRAPAGDPFPALGVALDGDEEVIAQLAVAPFEGGECEIEDPHVEELRRQDVLVALRRPGIDAGEVDPNMTRCPCREYGYPPTGCAG